MKKILGLIAIVACAACSSAKKQETSSTDAPAATAAAAPAANAEAAKTDAKNATASTAASSDNDSAFGPIAGTEKSSVTCTNKNDTRKISVLNVTEGGCGVVYNKAGEDKTVARAQTSMDYCDNVSNKIKSNLEAAGFDCGGGAATGTSTDTPAATPAEGEAQ